MRANELMIGDWVKHSVTGKVIRVSEFTLNEELDFQRYYVNGNLVENIEPIPLTAEILKKNGWIVWKANKMGVVIFTQYFEFSDNLLGIEDSIESRIDCDPYGDFHYMCNGKSLCYINSVHELQHVLKLCGIEKDIEL